jgi:NADPH-dependent ferric siderophore reductase
MTRVVLGGDGLAQFATRGQTDHYVKLLFPAPGVTYPGALRRAPDPRGVPARAVADDAHLHRAPLGCRDPRAEHRLRHPRRRGPGRSVGRERAARRRAALLRPRRRLRARRPMPTGTCWPGDESALPAIAAALEALPARGHGARVRRGRERRGGAEARRAGRPSSLDAPRGRADRREAGRGRHRPRIPGRHAAGVRARRSHLRQGAATVAAGGEGLPLGRLSVSGYWRLGHNEDGWQSSKREWNQQIEIEQESAAG